MIMEPRLDHGRLGGLGDKFEADSVKMIDMGTLDGFRESLARLVAACAAVSSAPMFAKILGDGERVAIGVVAPDVGTGYMLNAVLTAILSKIGIPMTVDEDRDRVKIHLGPEKEAELLIVHDESEFDGVVVIGGAVFSNVVDAENILEQFRLRISATFASTDNS
jgi:hypothetical protein